MEKLNLAIAGKEKISTGQLSEPQKDISPQKAKAVAVLLSELLSEFAIHSQFSVECFTEACLKICAPHSLASIEAAFDQVKRKNTGYTIAPSALRAALERPDGDQQRQCYGRPWSSGKSLTGPPKKYLTNDQRKIIVAENKKKYSEWLSKRPDNPFSNNPGLSNALTNSAEEVRIRMKRLHPGAGEIPELNESDELNILRKFDKKFLGQSTTVNGHIVPIVSARAVKNYLTEDKNKI